MVFVLFVVRLVGEHKNGDSIDHCIAIDGIRGLVLDAVEKKPLYARDGVLGHCVGDGYKLERVAEVRKVVQQEKRGGKKRRGRNPHTKEKQTEERRVRRAEEVRMMTERRKYETPVCWHPPSNSA